jgi:hypothetical protein
VLCLATGWSSSTRISQSPSAQSPHPGDDWGARYRLLQLFAPRTPQDEGLERSKKRFFAPSVQQDTGAVIGRKADLPYEERTMSRTVSLHTESTPSTTNTVHDWTSGPPADGATRFRRPRGSEWIAAGSSPATVLRPRGTRSSPLGTPIRSLAAVVGRDAIPHCSEVLVQVGH